MKKYRIIASALVVVISCMLYAAFQGAQPQPDPIATEAPQDSGPSYQGLGK